MEIISPSIVKTNIEDERSRAALPGKKQWTRIETTGMFVRLGYFCIFGALFKQHKTNYQAKNEPVAQLDRVSDSGSEGWGFESPLVHCPVWPMPNGIFI